MNDKTTPPLADIRRDFERVSAEIVKKAAGFAASILADVAGRRGTLDGRIQPLARSMRMAGPAFTIEVRAGDNLMIHAAISMAKPGDILVVDGKADRTCAGSVSSRPSAPCAGAMTRGPFRRQSTLRARPGGIVMRTDPSVSPTIRTNGPGQNRMATRRMTSDQSEVTSPAWAIRPMATKGTASWPPAAARASRAVTPGAPCRAANWYPPTPGTTITCPSSRASPRAAAAARTRDGPVIGPGPRGPGNDRRGQGRRRRRGSRWTEPCGRQPGPDRVPSR